MAKLGNLAAFLSDWQIIKNTEFVLLAGGLEVQRGSICEIAGVPSTGRAALAHSILAAATSREEACAVVDGVGSFDPVSAAANGVGLERLLWVRCERRADRAMQAADWILHAGGFGAVVLDLCGLAPETLRRIPLSWWFRFRRAIENTPTILAVAAAQPVTGSCAAQVVATERARPVWSGSAHVPLLAGIEMKIVTRKPAAAPALVEASWIV